MWSCRRVCARRVRASIVYCAMNLEDPATAGAAARPDSFTPEVHRLLLGELAEGPGYATYRRNGTTDWLLFHTLAGRGRLGTAGPDVIAAPGTTTLVRPGTRHDYGVEDELRFWHFRFAHFHPRPEWVALLDWPEVAPGISQLHPIPPVAQLISDGLAEAIRLRDSVWRHRELLSENAFESVLLWCATQHPATAPVDTRLLRAIELIDQDLRADLSVGRLARAATLSESRFAHLFRAQLGVSPQQFVERRRLEAAARLLDLTDRPVSSVARAVGFTDPLYFSTRFRRHTDFSPSAYRARR